MSALAVRAGPLGDHRTTRCSIRRANRRNSTYDSMALLIDEICRGRCPCSRRRPNTTDSNSLPCPQPRARSIMTSKIAGQGPHALNSTRAGYRLLDERATRDLREPAFLSRKNRRVATMWPVAKARALIILERLHDLALRRHDERPVLDDRLANRHTLQQHELHGLRVRGELATPRMLEK